MGSLLLLLLSPLWALSAWQELQLAQQYAPTIHQELGSEPAADEFTRVDFDGDWEAENNWDNLTRFPRPPLSYFSVIETERHYFITYALFFPRDYATFCFWMHCHENDFEGMRVTIEKPQRLKRLEALAHNRLSTQENPRQLSFWIERGGHGVHPLGKSQPSAPLRIYRPSDYQLISLKELWALRHSSLFRSHFTYQGRKLPAAFAGERWIIFGLGAAKPPWSWEIWNGDWHKGQWFMDPARGAERYLHHPFQQD